MSNLADQYSRGPHGGVDIPDAQKEARQDKINFDAERRSHRRTGRTRGIVVPELPWLREEQRNG